MSLRKIAKSLSLLGVSAFFVLAAPVWVRAQQPGDGCASGACFGTPYTGSCGSGYCQTHHCPPRFEHCMEEPPCIHFKCGCPRPVCNPCDLPHWGYFDKCWTPWPYPPSWTHCPTPPPAAFVTLNPNVATYVPTLPPRAPAPAPAPTRPNMAPNPMPPMQPGVDLLPQPQRYDPDRPF